jgi:hypothetical protein
MKLMNGLRTPWLNAEKMRRRPLVRAAMASAVFAVILLQGTLTMAPRGQARDGGANDDRIQLGLSIAPVPLNMAGKNPDLVGLGSYLVNAVGDCNGCHTGSPMVEFAAGRNPYFGQPAMVNPATYLVGGRDFGPLVPNSPDILSRNLTPDKTGMTGGHSFSEFFQIMRTGVDVDHLHPSCSSMVTSNCLPAPFSGALLQIMPWPAFQNLMVDDLRAIYEYLSALPCVEGGPGEPTTRCH